MVRLFGRAKRKRHELLSAYLDGEVTPEEAREAHDVLADSEEARRELAELQATVDLVRTLPEPELPRSFALDAAPEKRWTLWWPSVRTTGLAASVATMLLVGLVAGDMMNVLDQAGIERDDSAVSASPELAAGAAAESLAAPEAAVMKSLADTDGSAAFAAAPAAARMAPAPRQTTAVMSEESAPVMPQAASESEPPQAQESRSDSESKGFALPLMELQTVAAVAAAALAGAMLVALRRRRGPDP